MAKPNGVGLYEAQRLSNFTLTSQYLSPRLYLYLICIIQFAMLSYSISDQIPTQRDLKTGRELVSILQEIEGDVWMPFNGYLAVLASKKSSAHDMALCELKGCFGGDETEIWQDKMHNELIEAANNQRFSVIIFNRKGWEEFFEESYTKYEIPFEDVFGDTFWPVTGWRIRPHYLYAPKGHNVVTSLIE